MSNWLTKATGALAGEVEDVPQTFQLTCECSSQHTGQRKTRSQRIICQSCGTALFVLPKNAYPPPKPRPERKPGARKRSKRPPTGPGLPSTKELAGLVRRGMQGAAGGIGRGLGTAGGAVRDRTRSAAATSARSVRTFFSPFRLVLAGITVMLLTTAFLAIRSRSIDNARERLRVELAAAQKALAEDDFPRARDHFALAAAAVDTLQSRDPQSQLVQQLHRETTAMTRLAPGSLFDLLDEAEKSQERNAGKWQDMFRVRYQGTWFVLQAPIRRDGSEFVLDLPLTVGATNRNVVVRADIPAFEQLHPVEGVTNAVFAAPVVGCALDAVEDRWIVTLDSQAGFLWSHLENLRHLGFFESASAEEEKVAALLRAQSENSGGPR